MTQAASAHRRPRHHRHRSLHVGQPGYRFYGVDSARSAPQHPRLHAAGAGSQPAVRPALLAGSPRPHVMRRPGWTRRRLKPVFRPDGTVTAGNRCPLNDGAAAVVVMSDRKARELGITPLARIAATGVSALPPEIMGVRGAGDSRLPRARHRHRPAQRARRRHRAGPPVRHDRRPDHRHPAQRPGHQG